MSKTCPSSRCEEGALLLGTVREDGTIAFAAEPRAISRAFVEANELSFRHERDRVMRCP